MKFSCGGSSVVVVGGGGDGHLLFIIREVLFSFFAVFQMSLLFRIVVVVVVCVEAGALTLYSPISTFFALFNICSFFSFLFLALCVCACVAVYWCRYLLPLATAASFSRKTLLEFTVQFAFAYL